MSRKRAILLAVVGDTHCGSTLGLCPAGAAEGDKDDGVKLPEGGRYLPNIGQRWVWANWLAFWARARKKASATGAELWGLHLGDSREGDHHDTTELVSADDEVQSYVVTTALAPMRTACKRIYVCKGTEAHVGPGGDDATARWFAARRHPDTDAWAAYEWRLNINGYRINARHHAGMGQLPWTKHGAAVRLATQVFHEYADYAARTGQPLAYPHLVVRGHQHRFSDSGLAQQTRAIFCPAWQLATSFVHRISQSTLADIGGLLVHIDGDGQAEIEPVLYSPTLSSEVVA